ncbi:hypothetical protein H6501_00795 [Candidatus Woesearchaeota archaeon]|nr:hypothetical protein [Nanoarchaeota archaeon]MCB9370115.1 hypothetical protein [Candidatus Woesearchaeota archaeon]USN44646.1 MAG: hypothetical protein H6500_02270 [Candidatus Woesearchaeota archaeon]
MVGKQIVGAEINALVMQECNIKGYSQKKINSYLNHVNEFIASKKTSRDYSL